MPRTDLLAFRDERGETPLAGWLRHLEETNDKAFVKVLVRLQMLGDLGHELRRPHADILRDGIHELRAKVGRVNYRVLYFFHGRNVVVLTHGFTKEDKVPDAEIDRAVRWKSLVETAFLKHTTDEIVR